MLEMLKDILRFVLKELDSNSNRGSQIETKIIQIVEEINRLEIEHAKALADVERWGDIDDKSNYRTVEYNRIGRVIEAKKRMLETLKQNF
jgi:hypothetical protein